MKNGGGAGGGVIRNEYAASVGRRRGLITCWAQAGERSFEEGENQRLNCNSTSRSVDMERKVDCCEERESRNTHIKKRSRSEARAEPKGRTDEQPPAGHKGALLTQTHEAPGTPQQGAPWTASSGIFRS